MRKHLLSTLFIGLLPFVYGQNPHQLEKESNHCIIVHSKKYKCEIYYADGTGEELTIDEKGGKTENLEPSIRSLTMLINSILVSGYELEAVTTLNNSSEEQMLYFIRKEAE